MSAVADEDLVGPRSPRADEAPEQVGDCAASAASYAAGVRPAWTARRGGTMPFDGGQRQPAGLRAGDQGDDVEPREQEDRAGRDQREHALQPSPADAQQRENDEHQRDRRRRGAAPSSEASAANGR